MTISALRNCEVLQQSSFTALKKSAESGCDLCNLSYSAIVANYSHATTKIGDNEVKIIDILCRDQNPVRADKHDTRIYLEGQINDYYECDKFREKTDQIIVRVGDFSAGENSIHAFLKVGVNSGWKSGLYLKDLTDSVLRKPNHEVHSWTSPVTRPWRPCFNE